MRYLCISLILLGALIVAFQYVGPAPPAPESMDDLDPLVREVVAEAMRAARSNRRNHTMRVQLGMVYQANGMSDLALACYEQAAKMRPREAEIWYRIALIHDARAEMDAAIEHMRRSISLDGEYAAAHWRLGWWLLDAGELDQAEIAFRRAIDISPGERAAWFGLAQLHLQRNEPQEAISLITDRLVTGRDAAFAHHLLAGAYRRVGRHDEAARAARLAAPDPPGWSDPLAAEVTAFRTGYDAMRKRAEGLVAAGRFAAAIEPLERLRAEAPGAASAPHEDPALLTMLGVAYVATGQRERGLRTLREAIDIDPNNYPALINLARAYYHTADGSPAALSIAAMEARRAADAAPLAGEPWQVLGLIETARGNLEGAAAAYQRAFELDARDARPLLDAASLLIRLGRHDEAIETCRRVLQDEPDSGNAHVVMAMSFIAREQWDEAEAALTEARRHDTTTDALLFEAERRLAEKTRRRDAEEHGTADERR